MQSLSKIKSLLKNLPIYCYYQHITLTLIQHLVS